MKNIKIIAVALLASMCIGTMVSCANLEVGEETSSDVSSEVVS